MDSSSLILGGVAPPAYRQQHTPTAQSPRLSGFIDIFLYFRKRFPGLEAGISEATKAGSAALALENPPPVNPEGEHFYPGFFCGRIKEKKNPGSLPEGCTTWAKSLIARTQKPRTKAEGAVSTPRKNVHLISDRKNSTSNAIFRR